jgi:hypothetical protein
MIKSIEINEEKRIVTVTLSCEEGTFKGVAKCLKSDHFDPAIGEKIAYKRALLQVKKADIDIFKKEMDACEQPGLQWLCTEAGRPVLRGRK